MLYASNRSNASLLAEVSAHCAKFLERHLPHLPTVYMVAAPLAMKDSLELLHLTTLIFSYN